jgi:hypothetical protein
VRIQKGSNEATSARNGALMRYPLLGQWEVNEISPAAANAAATPRQGLAVVEDELDPSRTESLTLDAFQARLVA